MTRTHSCADGENCEGDVDEGSLCALHRADYGDTKFDKPAPVSVEQKEESHGE